MSRCAILLALVLVLVCCEWGTIDTPPVDSGTPDADADGDGDGDGDTDADAGGDADADGDARLIEGVYNAIDRSWEELCQCYYEGSGYPTPEACSEDATTTPLVRGCLVETYLSYAADVAPYYTCQLPAEEARLACIETAGCADEVLMVCDEERSTALEACPGAGEVSVQFESDLSECANGGLSGCPDRDSLTGLTPIEGSTEGQGDDLNGSCGGFQGPDVSHQWTAPAAGTYRLSTEGSSFDTILYVLSTCAGEQELICNDDIDRTTGNRASQVDVDLIANQNVVIVVDGWDLGDGGDYVLSFTEQ